MTKPATGRAPRLGPRANVAQFSLLVAVNALVGGILGQERTVLPLLAERELVEAYDERYGHLRASRPRRLSGSGYAAGTEAGRRAEWPHPPRPDASCPGSRVDTRTGCPQSAGSPLRASMLDVER